MTRAGWLIASLAVVSFDARAAGFDCKKASSVLDKTICSDAQLSDLDGKLADAYRRALSTSANPDSVRDAQRAWLKGERSGCAAEVACLKAAYDKRLAAIQSGAGSGGAAGGPRAQRKDPSFTAPPYISPHIVEALSTGLADHGDQVIAVNLTDAQGSNRYFDGDVEIVAQHGQNPYVRYREKTADPPEESEFGYAYLGRTTSGIDVLRTSESGGGSGRFENLMLVKIDHEPSGMFPEVPSDKDQTLTFKRTRLVIKKLGEIGLGDRWNGEVKVAGDSISIGTNTGWFTKEEPGRRRLLKIDYRP